MTYHTMQAYKIKGKIDSSGHLAIASPIDLEPGDVEVIILKDVEKVAEASHPQSDPPAEQPDTPKSRYATNIFTDWLAKTKPAPPDFDPDQARLEALEEKYR